MCGHTVAVEAGTTEEADAWGYMGKQPGGAAITGDKDNCTSAGKQDLTVATFATQTEANAALLSGPSDFVWADQPAALSQCTLDIGMPASRLPAWLL